MRMLGIALLAACGTPTPPAPSVPPPAVVAPASLERRPVIPMLDGRWIGAGVCYGAFRDGQRPGGPGPSTDQLREDLTLLAPRWNLLRVYASDGPTEPLLALIHTEHLPFRVLVGAWIAGVETPPAEAAIANQAQVDNAIRLANAYPDEVLGVVVGNETQVSWTAHRVDRDALIGHIRAVRAATKAPVATADDFSYWLTPESDPVAAEVDFIVSHAYAMWNGKPLDDAMAWTKAQHAAVVARHPGVPVWLGEAGWATQRHTEGDQATLIKGEAGEGPQKQFYAAFSTWTTAEKIPSTYFEAFDEPWKGGGHPDEVEKHWGLYRVDRTPKAALAP